LKSRIVKQNASGCQDLIPTAWQIGLHLLVLHCEHNSQSKTGLELVKAMNCAALTSRPSPEQVSLCGPFYLFRASGRRRESQMETAASAASSPATAEGRRGCSGARFFGSAQARLFSIRHEGWISLCSLA